jgi:AbrB family looped-hinge helix DNA binding protein
MHEGIIVGSATVGAKGQVVLPVNIRRRCDISPGETLIVMARPGPGGWSVALMKSSSLASMMEHMEATGKKIMSLVKKVNGGGGKSGGERKGGKGTGHGKGRGSR